MLRDQVKGDLKRASAYHQKVSKVGVHVYRRQTSLFECRAAGCVPGLFLFAASSVPSPSFQA